MSKNIVFEGWLTKSPPSKRIWRTKWRRRWFALRQSGELPGQYFLDYYSDRNCRRLKGTINLDLCEQVDAGLHMERTGNGTLDPKLRGSVFTIQTQSRIYHLEADCEADMEQWVDAICRVCGLRATDDSSEEFGTFPTNTTPIAPITSEPTAGSRGPYIPISECITGLRSQESPTFTFDPKNIVTSTRTPLDHQQQQIYTTQPQMKMANPEFSENESNLSDEDCKSLTSSQSNIRDFSVAKSFTKLTVSPKNEISEDGPPVPPRPPKTFAMSRALLQREILPAKPQEAADQQEPALVRRPPRTPYAAPPSPAKALVVTNALSPIELNEDDDTPGPQSMQYWNLSSMPPAVDRALKPRASNYFVSPSGSPGSAQTVLHFLPSDENKADSLQYLDLDLPQIPDDSSDVIKKHQDLRRRMKMAHGNSLNDENDADCAYKTVDFLKTEAFNITRADAEASRSNY